MEYRVLVDENTSPRVVKTLRDDGYTAAHIHEKLSEGVDDDTIVEFARKNRYIILTHDADFLTPDTRNGISVLYYSDEMMRTEEITARVEEVIELIPDPSDLPPLTNLHEWG